MPRNRKLPQLLEIASIILFALAILAVVLAPSIVIYLALTVIVGGSIMMLMAGLLREDTKNQNKSIQQLKEEDIDQALA